jgi:hypothetical protein
MQILEHIAFTYEELKNRVDARRIAVILDVLRDRIKIDEDGICFVARTLDKQAIKFLLEERGYKFYMTDNILRAAMENPSHRDKITYTLLEKCNEIKITKEIFRAAVESFYRASVVRLLLEQRGGEFKITEEIIEAAAGNSNLQILRLILEYRGDEVELTENILNTAA